MCQLCHTPHLLVGGIALADADVVGNGGIEEQHVLKHHGIVAEQYLGVDVGDVVSAKQYLSAVDVPEACGEFGGGALSASRRTDECRHFSLLCCKGNIVQYLFFGLVGKAHIAELDVVIVHRHILVSFLFRHSLHFLHAIDAHIEESKDGEVVAHVLNRIIDHCRNKEKCQINKD